MVMFMVTAVEGGRGKKERERERGIESVIELLSNYTGISR